MSKTFFFLFTKGIHRRFVELQLGMTRMDRQQRKQQDTLWYFYDRST